MLSSHNMGREHLLRGATHVRRRKTPSVAPFGGAHLRVSAPAQRMSFPAGRAESSQHPDSSLSAANAATASAS